MYFHSFLKHKDAGSHVCYCLVGPGEAGERKRASPGSQLTVPSGSGPLRLRAPGGTPGPLLLAGLLLQTRS